MIIYSQNLTNYGIGIPENALYRINLAWVNTLDELINLLEKHKDREIFLDLPIGRTKPPNNTYSLDDLLPILKNNNHVKYLAVSNVNTPKDIEFILEKIPNNLSIVPKIESLSGVQNIGEITKILSNKVVMLDHDDLYSDLIKKGEKPSKFKEHINGLIKFCNENNVILLRTIGVIFSDDEKRATQYIR